MFEKKKIGRRGSRSRTYYRTPTKFTTGTSHFRRKPNAENLTNVFNSNPYLFAVTVGRVVGREHEKIKKHRSNDGSVKRI